MIRVLENNTGKALKNANGKVLRKKFKLYLDTFNRLGAVNFGEVCLSNDTTGFNNPQTIGYKADGIPNLPDNGGNPIYLKKWFCQEDNTFFAEAVLPQYMPVIQADGSLVFDGIDDRLQYDEYAVLGVESSRFEIECDFTPTGFFVPVPPGSSLERFTPAANYNGNFPTPQTGWWITSIVWQETQGGRTGDWAGLLTFDDRTTFVIIDRLPSADFVALNNFNRRIVKLTYQDEILTIESTLQGERRSRITNKEKIGLAPVSYIGYGTINNAAFPGIINSFSVL